MRMRSIVSDAAEVKRAIDMIRLGARLQLLEAETSLSRERLLKLYKEVTGISPPKGMLPYSTDWFISWLPNIHASLFANLHRYLTRHARLAGVEALMTAYRLYLEHVESQGLIRELSFTRAWILIRFMQADLLTTAPCKRCAGYFVVHTHELYDRFVCGLCQVPSRAGKTRRPAEVAAL